MQVFLYKIVAIITKEDVRIPKTDLSKPTLQTILSIVFATAGAVSLLIITIAGFRLVMSQGNPEGV